MRRALYENIENTNIRLADSRPDRTAQPKHLVCTTASEPRYTFQSALIVIIANHLPDLVDCKRDSQDKREHDRSLRSLHPETIPVLESGGDTPVHPLSKLIPMILSLRG